MSKGMQILMNVNLIKKRNFWYSMSVLRLPTNHKHCPHSAQQSQRATTSPTFSIWLKCRKLFLPLMWALAHSLEFIFTLQMRQRSSPLGKNSTGSFTEDTIYIKLINRAGQATTLPRQRDHVFRPPCCWLLHSVLKGRHFIGRLRLQVAKVPEPTPAPTYLGRLRLQAKRGGSRRLHTLKFIISSFQKVNY